MLEVWSLTEVTSIREAAERVLQSVLERREENGAFRGWGFEPNESAFTHTVAYTLRGLIESADILDDWPSYGQPAEEALNYLYRQAELSGGRLPGAYDTSWTSQKSFTCLTGNAQVAICLLRYEQREADLRLVNAACKLVDYVEGTQSLHAPLSGMRGGIAGSKPIWGRYMRLRYPNWAAKFFCDALLLLLERLKKERL